ncbi:SLAIN1_2 [Acanthosepion pharaonis]|uniref:SLAIN1_2 n=1 Tax=Acanthosepion pharaonis TaxID=158019 RepID=A0A812BI74_ACAPH|nr:SLAIN1_2 [Sepia pharaonis]
MNSVSKKEAASPQDSSLVDPHAEVRKLQELVKKLELQNELLRSKQKLNNGDVDSKISHNGSASINNHQNQNNSCNNNNNNVHQVSDDDVDILDVNSLSSSKDDEYSWLYSSPKPPTERQTQVSPDIWVREEFDHPKPEVQLARKSLVLKLEEVARLSKTSPTLSGSYPLGNHVTSNKPRLGISELGSGNGSSTSSPVPSIKQPLLSTLGTRVDTNTFTRPKKNKDRLRLIPAESCASNKDAESQSQALNRIPDVSDIQNMAKLQEESLRQSISPLSSPRKEGLSCSRRNSHSVTSNSSEPNSPPDSPFGSQGQINCVNSQGHDDLRRSLPNVSKLVTPSPALHSSDSSLDTCSDDMLFIAGGTPESASRPPSRLQQPGRPNSPSVSHLKQPLNMRRGSSPIRSNLPHPATAPRRSIPRPGTVSPRTSLPTPKRSGIPFKPLERPSAPAPAQAVSADDSWKEGCF